MILAAVYCGPLPYFYFPCKNAAAILAAVSLMLVKIQILDLITVTEVGVDIVGKGNDHE